METKQGTFGWNELMTTDVEAAKKFYANVIGWGASDVQMGNPTSPAKAGEPSYTLWTMGDTQVGGAMKLEGPEMENIPPHWMSYVNVADTDDVAQKAVANGGKIIFGPMDVEGIGRFYIISDPQGAALGLAQTVGGES